MHKIVSTANTGMRRGEILGLRWGGVDFDTAHLSVTRSLISVGYELHETRGKSRTARRAVNLDPRTIHVLHAWRQLRANEDPEFDRDDPTATSSPAPTEHQLTHNCSRTRSRNSSTDPAFPGFDSTTCHTHATLLLKAGVPIKVVSERLGHSTPGFTMATYQHVIPRMQEQAAETFASLLEPGEVLPASTR